MRILFDTLRVADKTYWGLTLGQYFAFSLLGMAVFLIVRGLKRRTYRRHNYLLLTVKKSALKISGLVIIFFLSGCVGSMKAMNFELKNLKENEGIIIGSYLVNAKEWHSEKYEYESLYTYTGTKKSSDVKYEITMEKDSINFLTSRLVYKDEVSPGKEFVFIKNLSEDNYYINTVQKTGIVMFPSLLKGSGDRARFKVKRGKITYIGRLVVNIDPGKEARQFNLQVQDEQERTLSDLKNDYAEFLSNVEKKLMIIPDTTSELDTTPEIAR